MAISHSPYEHHEHDEVIASETISVHEPYGAVQIFAAIMGIFFVVIGAVGMARAGLDSLTRPSVEVAGMGMTALLSLIHLGIGVTALASAVSRSAARSSATVLGAGLIAVGIIALIEPVRSMGWTTANGVAYLMTGILAIASAFVTPAAQIGERHVTTAGRYVA